MPEYDVRLIDMDAALDVIEDQIIPLLEKLNEKATAHTDGNNRPARRESSAQSKDLLYAAHLCDVLKLTVMNEYHRARGKTPPTIKPTT